MSRKDEGYNWEHSDMGLTPEKPSRTAKASVTMNMKCMFRRYPEDTELTGTGTFVIHKKEDGKFGYTLSAGSIPGTLNSAQREWFSIPFFIFWTIFENQEGFGDSLLPSETIGFFVVYHENRYTGGER